MRVFALAIALLTPIISQSSEGDIEFPIDLTCELGAMVFLLHLEEDEKASWIMSSEAYKPKKMIAGGLIKKKLLGKKNYVIRNYKNTDTQILFSLRYATDAPALEINRYTLGISRWGYESGQCFKGFKTYTQKKI